MLIIFNKLKSAVSSTSGRYVLIGLLVYILELIVILTAQKLRASATTAVALSFWIGLVVSFFSQKLFTFHDKRMKHKILVPQLIAVSLLVLFNFGFTIIVTRLLVDYLPAVVTRTAVLGVTTIWNFYLYRTKIFHSGEGPLFD